MKNLQDTYKEKILAIIHKSSVQQRKKLLQIFLANFDLNNNKICADIGGISEGFEKIGDYCTAIAVNLELREKVQGWAIIIADARYLPFKDHSIDIVMTNSMLEHIESNTKRAVDQIKRVSKENICFSSIFIHAV